MTTNPNSPSADELKQNDLAHHWHPFTDHSELDDKTLRLITHADGSYIWDSNGNKILDGMAGLWCVNVGYGRSEIVDAVTKQMSDLPYYNTFFKSTHQPVAELAEKIASLTPGDLNHVFFTGSGSDANDTVLRLVRTYWAHKGKKDKTIIIARKNAYHGSTMAGVSLGGMSGMHEQGAPLIPDIAHIKQPYWFHEGGDMSPDEFGLECARDLEKKIDELGEDRIAAFIAEPVQGAGGVIIPPETYWPEIMRICKARDILFVADEVITGFGRLGEWFGSQCFGLQPDVIAMAKGLSSGYLPIGAVAFSDEISNTLQKGEFAHGYTYSGHPACCAAALANLKIIEEEKLIERVKNHTAGYFAKKWASLGEHPLVGEARSIGLVGALEMVPDKPKRSKFENEGDTGAICRDHCFNNGLVMRAVRDTMIVSPPLIITDNEIDEMVEKAWKSLDQTHASIGVK
ncbi:MAG: aspartate aminotransferase family protein [Rhizobiaceae bacterium]|nr:aspartate aminotransferase family protein [Rhizobiaceae bacterium]